MTPTEHFSTERYVLMAAEQIRDLQAEVERLREAMASAITSLETGPMRDGYAANVLRDALSMGSDAGSNSRD